MKHVGGETITILRILQTIFLQANKRHIKWRNVLDFGSGSRGHSS
jgi:hypothetical protein